MAGASAYLGVHLNVMVPARSRQKGRGSLATQPSESKPDVYRVVKENFNPAGPSGRFCRPGYGGCEVLGERLPELLVTALHHDANDGLSTRGSKHDSPRGTERLFGARHGLLDFPRMGRIDFPRDSSILEDLGITGHGCRELGETPAGLTHDREDL